MNKLIASTTDRCKNKLFVTLCTDNGSLALQTSRGINMSMGDYYGFIPLENVRRAKDMDSFIAALDEAATYGYKHSPEGTYLDNPPAAKKITPRTTAIAGTDFDVFTVLAMGDIEGRKILKNKKMLMLLKVEETGFLLCLARDGALGLSVVSARAFSYAKAKEEYLSKH